MRRLSPLIYPAAGRVLQEWGPMSMINIPEMEFLAYIQRTLEVPRAEARARLARELELSDPRRHAPAPRPRARRGWVSGARLRLGCGLMAAGLWLSGRSGEVL
jgi:hypothetical protein